MGAWKKKDWYMQSIIVWRFFKEIKPMVYERREGTCTFMGERRETGRRLRLWEFTNVSLQPHKSRRVASLEPQVYERMGEAYTLMVEGRETGRYWGGWDCGNYSYNCLDTQIQWSSLSTPEPLDDGDTTQPKDLGHLYRFKFQAPKAWAPSALMSKLMTRWVPQLGAVRRKTHLSSFLFSY